MGSVNKRSVMTLFTGEDVYSHQVRIVLAEKMCSVDIVPVTHQEQPEDFVDLNPYQTLPTLVERDLVLYDNFIIMEYLDERFPHPPLMPVYPIARAKARLLMRRIHQDWYTLYDKILTGNTAQSNKARQHLVESLVEVAPMFTRDPFFMSSEFSLVDCCLLPLLWNLKTVDIKLPTSAKGITKYMAKMFETAYI
jgi:Glutathione S-transferase